VDKTLILRKLAELEQHLERSRQFSGIGVDAYRSDWKTQRIVERLLQIMVEICIDIAGHIISDGKLRTPTGYTDAFRVLVEAGVLDASLGDRLERMAKFRNIVVHAYEEIDAAIVVGILSGRLDDFDAFKQAVLRRIK
jgi:uncharacterized protein YutE (UPF0331/DUF86 family)